MAAAKKQEEVDQASVLMAARRRLHGLKARDSLIDFTTFTMPEPTAPDDPDLSRYKVHPAVKLLAEIVERVDRGEMLRVAFSMPPQHGKSEIFSRRGPAWLMGRNPYRNYMFGTYNQDFAEEFGQQIREIMNSPQYQQVFPGCRLQRGSQAKDHLVTTEGGRMAFFGRGGSSTGRPADLFFIDDPLKDAKEADSETIRKDLWDWFTKVAYTRCHVGSAIVIVHTRWHEDDLIGRLCDPNHPKHDPEIAKDWTYINIPALFERPEDDGIAAALGKKRGDALWPERFPIKHLQSARRLNPTGFSALYQGSPTPDDGNYFKRETLIGYEPGQLPLNLRIYAASDHALTEKTENDANVLGCFGVDEEDNIWVLPDVIWERMETHDTVEAMISLMKRHRPLVWWAEDEHINKSLGPFRRKRQKEEKVYTLVHGIPPLTDLRARARSIQGRMAMKMIRFPKFAPWWRSAENELLRFPNATHDDFVSFMAMIGLGLDSEHAAERPQEKKDNVVRTGSIEWVKARANLERKQVELRKAAGGF